MDPAEFPFVISTRFFGFRNFAGEPFPVSASPQALAAVIAKAGPMLSQWGCPETVPLAECPPSVLRMLRERGLLAHPSLPLRARKRFKLLALPPQAEAFALSAAVTAGVPPASAAAMPAKLAAAGLVSRWAWVNEVEHATFAQAVPGLVDDGDFEGIYRAPPEGPDHQPWAWTARHGFLVSDPARLGPGFGAQLLAHLPGLALTGRLPQSHNVLAALGVAFRPVTRMETGESESALFDFRCGAVLGMSPREAYRRFLESVLLVLAWESDSQKLCLEKHEKRLQDRARNSLQVLMQARALAYPEFLAHSSFARLGAYLGMATPQILPLLEDLRITIQTGHLQVSAGRALSKEEEDMRRANVVRLSLERSGAAP